MRRTSIQRKVHPTAGWRVWDYMAGIGKERETRNHWQKVCKLILEEADVAVVSWHVRLALVQTSSSVQKTNERQAAHHSRSLRAGKRPMCAGRKSGKRWPSRLVATAAEDFLSPAQFGAADRNCSEWRLRHTAASVSGGKRAADAFQRLP